MGNIPKDQITLLPNIEKGKFSNDEYVPISKHRQNDPHPEYVPEVNITKSPVLQASGKYLTPVRDRVLSIIFLIIIILYFGILLGYGDIVDENKFY